MTVSGVRPAKGAGAVASAVRLVRSLISETHCAPLQVSFPTTFCCLEDLSTVSQKAILITGGAGYIGSHVLLQLQARGERVVALDNLSTGFRQAVRDAPLIVGEVGDRQLLERVLREHDVDTVMHFAANTIVPESVRDPLKYYGNNTCATRSLLEACMQHGVRQLVFSSTAAVYGVPAGGIATEDMALVPINPYGTSKLMSEWILRDLAAARTSSATRTTISFWFTNSLTPPINGIMTSGITFTPFLATSTTASKMARACISVISG